MAEGRELEGLKALGKETRYKDTYAPEVLEAFENKHRGNDYWVRFNCPEFTTLCPITGQPDFAEIRIAYVPDVKMVESKSLKLYLFSFRSHGDFHEDCVNTIMKDLIKLMDPKYIEVTGFSRRVAASPSILTPITAAPAPSGSSWPGKGWRSTNKLRGGRYFYYLGTAARVICAWAQHFPETERLALHRKRLPLCSTRVQVISQVSPGFTTPLNLTPSMPRYITRWSRNTSGYSWQVLWAIISHRITPGTMGLPGKCPWQ